MTLKTSNIGLSQFVVPKAARYRQEKRGGKPRCPACNFRIRGKKSNHEEGDHHLGKGRKKK